MGNCLVTKLKGIVENDNLIKYGELFYENTHPTVPYQIYFERNISTYVRLISGSGTYKINETNETVLPVNTEVQIDGTTANNFRVILSPGSKCVIGCKYNNVISQVEEVHETEGTLDSFDFRYAGMPNMRLLKACGHGSLKNLFVGELTRFIVDGYGMTDLSAALEKCKNSLLNFGGYSYGNIAMFDIADLGKCISLANIDTTTLLFGTVESFINAQRANGRTSGNCVIKTINNTPVTYNGQNIYNLTPEDTRPNKSIKFTWDANNISYEPY